MSQKKKYQPRSITPTNALRGLSSAVNRDYVLQIFSRSTHNEIANLLQQAEFRMPTRGDDLKASVDRNAVIDKEVAAFLRTPEGARQRTQRIEEKMKADVKEWFQSTAGQQKFIEVKAAMLSIQASKDHDLYTKACSQALAEQVSKWLRSPLGQAQLEEEKQRAVNQKVEAEKAPKNRSILQQKLEELKNA